MSDWWSYRPSDFILYSARSWWRTVELANADVWPTQLVTVALGIAAATAALRRPRPAVRGARFAWLAFAVCWAWAAWAFHWRHHASINWAAPWFAALFAVEAALLALAAATVRDDSPVETTHGLRRALGVAALSAGVLLYPLVSPLLGRPWTQAETFGLAPDPTALANVGLLLVLRGARPWLSALLWPIPVASLAIGAVTLATMR